ncbi:hypothetical protein NDU88_002254 [Pleurodeles waltl]|uniref:Uncharacterized protein n=1 Tax=Pleurodeles waltl TaxID=8319 RepID=A0AAV7WPN8_PLEWA|nr:hypothetical protein NDU88_002254 [Pleurodeles waltl]
MIKIKGGEEFGEEAGGNGGEEPSGEAEREGREELRGGSRKDSRRSLGGRFAVESEVDTGTTTGTARCSRGPGGSTPELRPRSEKSVASAGASWEPTCKDEGKR